APTGPASQGSRLVATGPTQERTPGIYETEEFRDGNRAVLRSNPGTTAEHIHSSASEGLNKLAQRVSGDRAIRVSGNDPDLVDAVVERVREMVGTHRTDVAPEALVRRQVG